MPQADYSLLQPRPTGINTPFENLGAILALRNQQQAAQALAEQRLSAAEENRQQIETRRREEAAAAQVRSLFARPNQPPTPEELSAVIGPEAATKIFQGFEALTKARGDNQDATRARIASVLGAVTAFPTDDLRAKAYQGARAHLIQDGTLKPEDAPEEYSADFVKNALTAALSPEKIAELQKPPSDYTLGDQRFSGATNQAIATAAPKSATLGSFEDYLTRYAAQRRMKPEQLSPGDVRQAKAQYEAAGRAPAQGQQQPWQWVMRGGKQIYTNQVQPGDERPAGSEKPSSGVQKRALNFFNRAAQADTELEQMEANIQHMGLMEQGRMEWAPNFLQSQLGQSYGAAQRAFTEARLRKDSGAAIPEQEFANDRRTYFAQPGDSQKTLEQKRRARATLLASLGFEAGQALGEFVGDADEAKAIVERYKTRSAGGGAANPSTAPSQPSGERVRVKGPNGERGTMLKSEPLPPGWSVIGG